MTTRQFRMAPITRYTAEELDRAIADLEQRGFRCKRRGVVSHDRKFLDRKYSSNRPYYQEVGGETAVKHWAVMERVTPHD
ncbi:hypothetical protein [Bhargavaea ginsengi]|uniref:hypothetical protein n=1 Tax=Bhargavaea ginsengi TaxID=426757 RepID=UPI003C770A1A